METFGFELAETARAMRREFDRRAAAHGTTRAQWRVLFRLARHDGARQVDLAEALDVEPITMCRMIDRLEDAGLVERKRDEDDRRAWNIHLTAKAPPVIEELRAIGEDFYREAMAGIPAEERQRALDVLARIRANLSDVQEFGKRKAS